MYQTLAICQTLARLQANQVQQGRGHTVLTDEELSSVVQLGPGQ